MCRALYHVLPVQDKNRLFVCKGDVANRAFPFFAYREGQQKFPFYQNSTVYRMQMGMQWVYIIIENKNIININERGCANWVRTLFFIPRSYILCLHLK